MWKTQAASASSNGLCEGWDRFTVPRFAWTGHFHGSFACCAHGFISFQQSLKKGEGARSPFPSRSADTILRMQPQMSLSSVMGNSRMRLPVAL